jgi:hypothetical protein
MAAGSGGLAGLGQKWPSGLGFEHGLHGQIVGATGIASRGSGWRDGHMAAARGRGALARNHTCV